MPLLVLGCDMLLYFMYLRLLLGQFSYEVMQGIMHFSFSMKMSKTFLIWYANE